MLATKIPQTQTYRLYSDYLEELIDERTKELKEAQEKLLKSQKLAAIGEVAAMVGHDLRNPLQAIVNTLYLAEKNLMSPSDYVLINERLETIKSQVEYMNKIVSDLQDYSRPLNPQLVETDISNLIDDMLLSVTLPENIRVSVQVGEAFPSLKVDPTMIKRVLTNLVTNAQQAMPDGGQLTIKLSKTGETVLISVQDTGIGIPDENLDKLFKPLFTTKSKGQGLGLAVCKRMIEALNGTIIVVSTVDVGSTFTIKLPVK
jgi:signal transduction histidine kinase